MPNPGEATVFEPLGPEAIEIELAGPRRICFCAEFHFTAVEPVDNDFSDFDVRRFNRNIECPSLGEGGDKKQGGQKSVKRGARQIEKKPAAEVVGQKHKLSYDLDSRRATKGNLKHMLVCDESRYRHCSTKPRRRLKERRRGARATSQTASTMRQNKNSSVGMIGSPPNC
jgi:hypothetical protein